MLNFQTTVAIMGGMKNISPTLESFSQVLVCFFPQREKLGSVLIFSWSSAPSTQAFYFSSIVVV
jgi:hypothetical protein